MEFLFFFSQIASIVEDGTIVFIGPPLCACLGCVGFYEPSIRIFFKASSPSQRLFTGPDQGLAGTALRVEKKRTFTTFDDRLFTSLLSPSLTSIGCCCRSVLFHESTRQLLLWLCRSHLLISHRVAWNESDYSIVDEQRLWKRFRA